MEITEKMLDGRYLKSSDTFITNGIWAVKKKKVDNFNEDKKTLSFTVILKKTISSDHIDEASVVSLLAKAKGKTKLFKNPTINKIRGLDVYCYQRKGSKPLCLQKKYVDEMSPLFDNEVWAINNLSVAFSKKVTSLKQDVAMIMPINPSGVF